MVGPTKVDLDKERKFVQTGVGEFWQDGWENFGEQMTDAAGKTIYTDGYTMSNSIMVEDREEYRQQQSNLGKPLKLIGWFTKDNQE